MKSVRLAAAAALAGTVLLTPAAAPADAEPTAAPATAASARFPGAWPQRLVGTAASLHPEGIAWDPTRRALLVSSVRHGTVSVLRQDGSVRTLVRDPGIISSYGIHVDAARGRLYVAYADLGVAERSTPRTALRTGGVGVFDLATGRRIHLVDLTRLDPGRAAYAVNDVTVAPDGTAYVSDVFSDAVYRVDRKGRASVLVRDTALTDGKGTGINGIVYHRGGFLLGVNTGDGRLVRIPLRDPAVHTVALDTALLGGDGLAVRRDGSVVSVTNSLGSPAGHDAVRVLRSTDGWRTARAENTTPWPERGPSTVALTPHGSYVLSGRLEVVFGPGNPTTDDFVARRFG
ncbi:SMP-30/gluconolactonase/LRE family protein [Streptomyces sp. NPDC004284]|uniref:SMP-30/gluconolactonase/LRE family protein n=1 Tax=Streptomyces sp. NPDC004284 TaxID=3364695 RepID=UPI003680AF8C